MAVETHHGIISSSLAITLDLSFFIGKHTTNLNFSIFWSWQSDAPDKCNRRFIRRALDDAIAEIAKGATVDESPRVESGMEGTAGTPDVAKVMFDKIDRSDMILCDVTLVGNIKKHHPNGARKKVPNPNVAVEMGYGAGRIGWNRVICVMNEKYGLRTKLPFDVKSKRYPVNYTLDPESMQDADKVLVGLTKDLKNAINACLTEEHQAVLDALASLDIVCLNVCSVFHNSPSFPDIDQCDRSNELKMLIPEDGFRSAVQRLLDLRLLKTDVQDSRYAYHWTHRGHNLLGELAKRNFLLIKPIEMM